MRAANQVLMTLLRDIHILLSKQGRAGTKAVDGLLVENLHPHGLDRRGAVELSRRDFAAIQILADGDDHSYSPTATTERS